MMAVEVGGSSNLLLLYVVPGNEDSFVELSLSDTPLSYIRGGVAYHRLDEGIGTSEIRFYCMLLNQLASTDVGSVYISPRAYGDGGPESVESGAALWAYLTDSTSLITNLHLPPSLKSEVGSLSVLGGWWKRRWDGATGTSGTILRRFMATLSGILISHPALLAPSGFLPHRRHWFTRALANPGLVVLTGPYLDPSGAGYILTLSHTLSLNNKGDTAVYGVMGMDVTPGMLDWILSSEIGLCAGLRCLLLDERGYLLTAPTKTKNGEREPSESLHITHQEPRVAVELLQRGEGLLVKRECRRVGSSVVEREYWMGGERAAETGAWDLVRVPGSDARLLFLNASARLSTAFCPCSVSDRRCLNCKRDPEPQDCECPCQCPLLQPWRLSQCPIIDLATDTTDIANCEPLQAPFPLPNIAPATFTRLFNTDSPSQLPQCIATRCDNFDQAIACNRMIGCSWCEVGEDGRSVLEKAYCGGVGVCFGGVVGRSPGGEYALLEEGLAVSTPVGPVAGAMMGVFVLLVIGVSCYRYQVTRLVEGRGSPSGSGARLNLASSEELEEFQFDHEGSAKDGCAPVAEPLRPHQLASFERGAPPRARRHGPRTESSDHGYSTMTGNAEDSEHASNVEALVAFRPRPGLRSSHRLSAPPLETFTLLYPKIGDCDSNLAGLKECGSLSSTLKEGISPETTLNASSIESENTTVIITAQIHQVDAL